MDEMNANEQTKAAWNRNAAFWDERMGEGNDFVNILCWPNLEKLLNIHPGDKVLDIACGNGLTSRRLAALGACVTAFDFSSEMIAHARQRTADASKEISYQVLDAADRTALLTLGEARFDAALCNMALFDMADIKPLFSTLPRLLRAGGIFVFSVIHPCFNSSHMSHIAEKEDREGEITTTYSLKIYEYITPKTLKAAAIQGQPQAQLVFHRPLQMLLAAGFEAGLIIDALLEPAFAPEHPEGRNLLGWNGHFHEFPPVLVIRMRTQP